VPKDVNEIVSTALDGQTCHWCRRWFLEFSDPQAAVKAVTWSPHKRGILASGGGQTDEGSADSCMRILDTVNNTSLLCLDTGIQVCNLLWSKNVNEIVSTHRCPLNQTIAFDGQTITGTGDERLCF